MPLLSSLTMGNKTVSNRIAINAMECCDADTSGNPTDTAFRRYERLARGNAGVIIVEALSVVDENKGRMHQLTALAQNQKGLTDLVAAMRKANPKPVILWQLTHSGELSSPEFSERVCVKPFPGYEGRLLAEEEVDEILERFVYAAKLASDCGADGVDFKLSHGYLGSQLLRPFNDRKWKYGGSWANRTRFAYEFYERVAREVKNPSFIVGSKISAWEGLPGGMGSAGPDTPIIDLTEVLDLVKGLEARGAKYIVQSAGNPSLTLALTQPDKKIPDYAYLHFWFQKEFRKARLEKNLYKIKKLTEVQREVMAKSMSGMQTQMKLMPVTMAVIIPVFAWLSIFVYQLPSSMFSAPWYWDSDLVGINVLPNWILLYSVLTMPFGQILSRMLKYFSFRKRLLKLESGRGAANEG